MPIRHIALVPESGMNPSDLARVSAGLQKQVTRDLGPIWDVSATIDSFPSLEDVPAGYWPVILTFRDLGSDAGIHVDGNGQPFALIEVSPSWSLAASHVCLEMLTDPFGGRTFPGPSPRQDQGDVEFMGGVCDACEHPDYAYLINDVLVSDFCTPAFWESSAPLKERRSFTGAIETSLQVLPGGHLSWYEPATNSWWLRRNEGSSLSDVKVGIADVKHGSVREFISGRVPHLESTRMTPEAFEARVGVQRQRALRASQSRAYWLRASLENFELDDAVRAALGAVRTKRDPSGGRQALSHLLRMSLGQPTHLDHAEPVSRGVPKAPGASEMDGQTMVVDETVFEKEASERAGEPSRTSPSFREQVRPAQADVVASLREDPDSVFGLEGEYDGVAQRGARGSVHPSPRARSQSYPPPIPTDPPRGEHFDARGSWTPADDAVTSGPSAHRRSIPSAVSGAEALASMGPDAVAYSAPASAGSSPPPVSPSPPPARVTAIPPRASASASMLGPAQSASVPTLPMPALPGLNLPLPRIPPSRVPLPTLPPAASAAHAPLPISIAPVYVPRPSAAPPPPMRAGAANAKFVIAGFAACTAAVLLVMALGPTTTAFSHRAAASSSDPSGIQPAHAASAPPTSGAPLSALPTATLRPELPDPAFPAGNAGAAIPGAAEPPATGVGNSVNSAAPAEAGPDAVKLAARVPPDAPVRSVPAAPQRPHVAGAHEGAGRTPAGAAMDAPGGSSRPPNNVPSLDSLADDRK